MLRTVSVILWAIAVLLGSGGLWYYAARAGEPAAAPVAWPVESPLHLDARRPTLVVALHPQCPCSRATVEQLARLASEAKDEFSAIAIVALPPGSPGNWADAPLVRAVRQIPSVTTVIDHDGTEAARFGALTSGQAYLYDPAGRLLFAGGITPSRGHAGDNEGSDAILAAVRRRTDAARPELTTTTPTKTTAVYGCPLFGSCPNPSARIPPSTEPH